MLRESGSLVMIDLNRFKEINDTYGHIIGDKVLMHVSLKLQETGGRVIRYGGDEFVVIFDQAISAEEIRAKITKVLHYFQKVLFKTEEKAFKISFAYGISPFYKGSNVSEVIEMADHAMYQNKKK